MSVGTRDVSMYMRDATLDDYDQVLALDPHHTIYDGNDYLPAVYRSWLNDPNKRIKVCVSDSKIVALAASNVVDDGQTLVGMAARVHVNERNSRIWSQMRTIQPGNIPATAARLAFISKLARWKYNKFKADHMLTAPRFLMTRTSQIHQFSVNGTDYCAHKDDRTNSCRALTNDESRKLLSNRENQWRLFPNKHIVCSVGPLVPYRLMDSNFQRIVKENEVVATINSTGSEHHSLSFGCGVKVHNGFLYSVHYYGSHPADDVSDLVNHVMVHLQIAAKQQTKQPLQLRIVFSPLMPHDDVTRALEQVPGHEKCVLEPLSFAVYESDIDWASVHVAKL